MPLLKSAGLPDFVMLGETPARPPFVMRARLLGLRIDTRSLLDAAAAGTFPDDGGLTVAFRDGVIVSVGAEGAEDIGIDALVRPYVIEPDDAQETETTGIVVRPGSGDRIAADGQIQLIDSSPDRLLLVAIVLARSVMLSRDEILVSEAFDRIAPLVGDLRENGRSHLSIRAAMQLVGNALAARHRIMGTAQANDRPDLLWDHPELDRLYARLEGEYELDERADVLERKFVALGDVAEILLDIVRDKRAFRLEIAVIGLIGFEIVLSLISMAMR